MQHPLGQHKELPKKKAQQVMHENVLHKIIFYMVYTVNQSHLNSHINELVNKIPKLSNYTAKVSKKTS